MAGAILLARTLNEDKLVVSVTQTWTFFVEQSTSSPTGEQS